MESHGNTADGWSPIAAPSCNNVMATVPNPPEGLDEPLHLLSFSLDLDLGLELPQGIVQVHTGEVHLIHHTAGSDPEGGREGGREGEREREKGGAIEL